MGTCSSKPDHFKHNTKVMTCVCQNQLYYLFFLTFAPRTNSTTPFSSTHYISIVCVCSGLFGLMPLNVHVV